MTGTCFLLEDFLQYLTVIRVRSANTVDAYRNDLSFFLAYLLLRKSGISSPTPEQLRGCDLSRFDEAALASVERRDILEYLAFTANARENNARTRARKLSAIKTFFRYHASVMHTIATSPAAEIDSPKQKRTLPRYLNEEESISLLSAVLADASSRTTSRDYAILTLFLNCGMRLSELIGINLSDLDSELRSLRVLGKGAKERIIYLNHACREAISLYLPLRDPQGQAVGDAKNALFLSSRHLRISRESVQKMVYKYLALAGLSHKQCSVHKLRHTAATLMYRSGEVDIRVLKDILGHEQLATTQIYTHLSDTEMERAMTKNPLSSLNPRAIQKN